ncbi:MAG TPA: hypothetical protein VMU56_08770 [Beijerinckiaceae bacterium]|nr:hypothetical protein [Beijerinckiaceae bacterium]HVB89178.1 hypothetical protein [Beijerinckiaceae bacterium]
MKIGLNIIGVLLLLIGGVWMLQGLNILGGSFMSGQNQWFVIGAMCAVAALVLLGWVNFARS